MNRAIEYSALKDLRLRVMAAILKMMATFRDERARSSPDGSTSFPCINPRKPFGPGCLRLLFAKPKVVLTKHLASVYFAHILDMWQEAYSQGVLG